MAVALVCCGVTGLDTAHSPTVAPLSINLFHNFIIISKRNSCGVAYRNGWLGNVVVA